VSPVLFPSGPADEKLNPNYIRDSASSLIVPTQSCGTRQILPAASRRRAETLKAPQGRNIFRPLQWKKSRRSKKFTLSPESEGSQASGRATLNHMARDIDRMLDIRTEAPQKSVLLRFLQRANTFRRSYAIAAHERTHTYGLLFRKIRVATCSSGSTTRRSIFSPHKPTK